MMQTSEGKPKVENYVNLLYNIINILEAWMKKCLNAYATRISDY